jgi:hypothetical protein
MAAHVLEQSVRLLVVHHSDTPNGYAADDVPRILRSIHRFHTTEKGWPDVAYNFFIDNYGFVWEGRLGSLDRRVVGDATGGNQGYSQLCCFVGDFKKIPPSRLAWVAAEKLLAALADTTKIDTSPTAIASFVSRGSTRLPEGDLAKLRTIEAHRTLSQTTCPGDFIGGRIESGELAAAVHARRKQGK